MYPYARTIYSQHLTGRTKVLYEREADIMTMSIYFPLFVMVHMFPNFFENIPIYITHVTD